MTKFVPFTRANKPGVTVFVQPEKVLAVYPNPGSSGGTIVRFGPGTDGFTIVQGEPSDVVESLERALGSR